ncbi:MAG: ASCH domain-containing protein [Pseudomonadota bacterium]
MTKALPTVNELLARYPGADTFRFGDTPDLVAELTGLVRSGKKRATCTHLAELEAGAQKPEVGRCDIALNFDGTPALVIKTLEVRETTFADMTEEMALMEGEDESLAGWRANHESYYRRHGVFEPDMVLFWERFDVVEDFGEIDV